MVFSSVVFLFIFLPWTLIIHYFLDPRYRNFFLLLSSLVFYSWGEGLLTILILLSIAVNYFGGLLIGHFRQHSPKRSKWILGGFLTLNVLVLVYFKYFNFLLDNLHALGLFQNITPTEIHLPIGISFYTFHIMSYLVDVYRRDATPQKNPFDLGLYIFLFPQLVAGPIIRYKDISQKIASRYIIGPDFTKGITRFARGFAKKMIIANNVALIADYVFSADTGTLSAPVAWLGIVCYTLQIYFDFSGYSDMAIGLGRMLGFNFPENFNYPYVADSIREFWQRWHMSLSTWFRDYLYIPLGGNKAGKGTTYRNLFIVFFVTGLWHGASWNFIVWGLFHGCFLVFERLGLSKLLKRAPGIVRHAYTLFVVVIAWVFFRANDLEHALKYLGAMFGGATTVPDVYAFSFLNTYTVVVLTAGIILCTDVRKFLHGRTESRLERQRPALLHPYYILSYCAHIAVFIYGVTELAANNYNPFIYFRF